MRITDVSITNPILRKTRWQHGAASGAQGTVLVSLTDFQIESHRDLVSVCKTALAIQRSWHGREGSLGLALWVHPVSKRLGSLSAWKSDVALHRWLRSQDHVTVVSEHRGHMRNVSSATWETERFDVEQAWQEVGRRWATTLA